MKRLGPALKFLCYVGCLLFMLALCFWPLVVHAQIVNSDHVKIQSSNTGSLAGDTNKALVVAVYRGTSAPGGALSAGMLWLDTNTTPPILKEYTGSVWNIPLTPASVAVQNDLSSFPGTPTDGQIFFAKSPHALCAYDGTATTWYCWTMPYNVSAASIVDVYTAAVIGGGTIAAPTVAASATTGSLSAGAYLYKVSCRNSTGGETSASRATASASVSPGSGKSTDLSAIPTCSTGGTTRSIYRTKTGTTSPYYWVYTLADNTTTTLNDGVADTALKGLMPDIDFSAALPGSWTMLNLATNGGCGGTGSSRASLVCYNGGLATLDDAGISTDGANPRLSLSIASYSSGNYTLQYRLKQASQNGDTYLTMNDPIAGGLRQGTGDNAIRVAYGIGNGNTAVTMPLSSSNHPYLGYSDRTTTGGSSVSGIADTNWPQVDALPMWFKVVRKSSSLQIFSSGDQVNWTPFLVNTTPGNTNTGLSTTDSAAATDHFEIPFSLSSGAAQSAGNGPWIEIDNFTLTVN